MKKPVTKNLGEENRNAITGQFFQVHAGINQPLGLADGHPVHALHHHDVGHAEVPDHLGNQDQIKTLHIAAQLGSVRSFPQQVQLIVQVFIKLTHHLARFQALAIF